MTDTAITRPAKLDIARVIEGTIRVLGRNFVTYAVLALILSGLPAAVVALFQITALRGEDGVISMNTMFTGDYWAAASLGGIAALIFSAVLQGTLIYATVQDLNGERPSIADCLATGLRSFLPLIGVMFLFILALAFGAVLLIVPAFMIGCAWCVAIPSLVADRTGVFGAFSRSAELTRGNRWRIFGLGVVIWIVLLVIGAVFNAVTGVSAFGTDPAQTLNRALSPLALGLGVIRSTISAVIGATLISVLYVELRRLREGAAPQWLAEIFS